MTACPYTYPTGPGFVSVYRVGAHGTKLTDSAVNQMGWQPGQQLGVTGHDDRLVLTPGGDDLTVRSDADNARSIGLSKRIIEPLAVD